MTATTVTYMPSHRASREMFTHNTAQHSTQLTDPPNTNKSHTLVVARVCVYVCAPLTRCRLHKIIVVGTFPSVHNEFTHATYNRTYYVYKHYLVQCSANATSYVEATAALSARPFPFNNTWTIQTVCKRVCGEWVFNKHINNTDECRRMCERHTQVDREQKKLKVEHISMWIVENKGEKKAPYASSHSAEIRANKALFSRYIIKSYNFVFSFHRLHTMVMARRTQMKRFFPLSRFHFFSLCAWRCCYPYNVGLHRYLPIVVLFPAIHSSVEFFVSFCSHRS